MTILFVCSGNTCRSPLAVAAWRAQEAADDASSNLAEIEVASAGLIAHKGALATPHAQKIALLWKTDLSSHRARGLTQTMAQNADLIFTMTQQQAQAVRRQFDLPTHRVHVLGEFNDAFRVLDGQAQSDKSRNDARLAALCDETQNRRDCDIADPFGASLEAYESCASQIENAVVNLRRALRDGAISP